MRLVKGWQVDDTLDQPGENKISIHWFEAVFNRSLQKITALYDSYRLSEALMAIYKLIWDDFCSWFLEMIKPGYQQPIDKPTYTAVHGFFIRLINVLHPFMPFITEEIWQTMEERKEGETIMLEPMPQPGSYDETLIRKFEFTEEVIIAVRNIRKEKNIPQKEAIHLFVKKNNDEIPDMTFDIVGCKLCNISKMDYVPEKIPDSITFVAGTTEFYIPVTSTINMADEVKKIQEELAYTRGFLDSVRKKLGNENFLRNAPEKVVAAEQKKEADAEARIIVLENQLHNLEN